MSSTTHLETFNLFGIEIGCETDDSVSMSASQTEPLISESHDQIARVLGEATDEVRTKLDLDFSGQVQYSQPAVGPGVSTINNPFPSSSSVFRDSGLPRIIGLSRFTESIVPRFAAEGTVPFFEVDENSVRHIWSARNLLQRNQDRRRFGNLFRFLIRMRWRDSEEWQGRRSERWEVQHRGLLAFYMTELFAGRFVDRNGTASTFSLGIDLTDFSELANFKLSPQMAGKIVGTLVEFLGDRLFQVPYYAPAILSHFQSHRALEAAILKNEADVNLIATAIQAGMLDSTQAEELGLPVSGDLDWTLLYKTDGSSGEVPTDPSLVSNIVGSRVCRLLSQRVQELDTGFGEQSALLAASDGEIEKILNGSSQLQSRYTIHASGLQTNAMTCIFLPEESGTCDAGSIGGDKDYSDLVGKLVKLAGESAERNVSALMGGVVRGISLFALDNEVVAEVISSAAAVASKKAAEAFTYSFLTRFIANVNIPLSQRQDTLERWAAIHQRLEGEE